MIDKLQHARILVVGDVMLDRFVQGEVARISPEAPVPVFRWSAERQMLGGAGNVIANLRTLGAATSQYGGIQVWRRGVEERCREKVYYLGQLGVLWRRRGVLRAELQRRVG